MRLQRSIFFTGWGTTERAQPLNQMADPGICNEPAACSSEDLMKQVQQGDMHAYQELVRRFQKKVFRVITTYLRNQDDAMEVLQDTFLKVYTSRSTWENRFTFAGWVYRIAINASIDRYRRSDRNRNASLEDVMEAHLKRSATAAPERDPLDRLRDRERRRMLEAAVRRLPQRQREVVALRFFGEMRLEEIAAALHCPLGTVKSNLHKAVIGLKEMLLGQKGVLEYE
jgi:RNA polymerase sigma-70 factor (ECF subfamily)